uniref:ADP compounds hydrolase NudE n=1 Tax=Ningiella ruwaisensis TaxID=2364274 RepID=UPI00109EFCC6|nr:ADP compounds hydrolase NudE [Ningiella ruwaisensis]
MSKINPNKKLPTIHKTQTVAHSRFFKIEQVDLEFSNGATREFERMGGSGRGAVMIVPLIDDDTMLLIREYAAGTHSYQLGFPKGLIDLGETPEQAANRELQEEVGYKADELSRLRSVMMAPTFFNASMHILVAKCLTPSSLEGDEPEPLEVVKWSINDADALLQREDFAEARSVAALLLLLRARQQKEEDSHKKNDSRKEASL